MRITESSTVVTTLALLLALAGGAGADAPPAGGPEEIETGTEAPSATAAAPAPANRPPEGVAAHAATLPPLPQADGVLALPLAAGDAARPFAWRPVRDGVALDASEAGLTASYRVVTGQPAGAALVVRPGTFAGVEGLRIRGAANRNAQLLVTLQDAAGAVYSLPAVPVRVGAPREHERYLDEATYFPPQSSAADSGGLDPAEIVMITLLDISGFMGSDTPEVEWTVEAIEGVAR